MNAALITALFVILLLLILNFILLCSNNKLKIYIKNNDKVADAWHTLAITDALTGVYNRTAYNQHISKINSQKKAGVYGIILFDIDSFKEVNDTQGHLAGDAVLKKVAKTLLLVYGAPEYTVYRIGGDEFAIIAVNITEERLIGTLLNLRDTLELEGEIRLSKGYSIVEGSINKAFRNADEMLYADKMSKKK